MQLETPANADQSKHIALKYPDGSPIKDATGAQVYAVDPPQYLGPTIVAQRDRPVRVKFTNYLPAGAGGNLFLPVDTTLMGAGMGPLGDTGGNYTQNRATLHLHGGATPWISDGTPYQWTTPAADTTTYKRGVSVQYVPDMWFDATTATVVPAGTAGATNDPGPGSLTFYYTNQQSARLMFYHDHAFGITRLNVYAGEAAPYLLQDKVEQDFVNGDQRLGRQPRQGEGHPRHPDPAGHPGQDLRAQRQAARQRRPDLGRRPTGAARAASGCRTSTCRTRTPTTQGVNAMGRWDYNSWFYPPAVPPDRTGRSPTRCSARRRSRDRRIPGTPDARDPPTSCLSRSWTRRSSTAPPTRTSRCSARRTGSGS